MVVAAVRNAACCSWPGNCAPPLTKRISANSVSQIGLLVPLVDGLEILPELVDRGGWS